MRITEIHVDHFGILRDVSVAIPSDGPAVLLGHNEAGKSTLLAFIRAMLFGIPKGRPKDERIYPMAEHRIGVLQLQTQAHGELRLERRRGAHGGPVTITDATGRERAPELLRELVGGVDREIYRSIYGFSLDELQNIETVTGDSVVNAFHAASLGTERDALKGARSTIDKQLGQLFKPSGRNQEAAALLSELEAVEKQLRQHEGELESYERMRRERKEREAEREALQKEVECLRARLNEKKKILNAWDPWLHLRQVESRLEDLPEVREDFPEDGVLRLDSLQKKAEALRSEKRPAEEERRQIDNELQELNSEWPLLAHAARIQAFERRLPSVTAAREEIPALQKSLHHEEQRLGELLPELGKDSTETELDRIDRSVDTQHSLRRFRDQLKSAGEVLTAARQRAESARDQREQHEQSLQSTENEIRTGLCDILPVPPPPESELKPMLERLRRIPAALRQIEAARSSVGHRSLAERLDAAAAGQAGRVCVAAALLLLLGSLALGLWVSPAWAAGVFAGSVLSACCAAFLWALSRSGPSASDSALPDARDEVERLLGRGAAERWSAVDFESRLRQLETLRDRLSSLQQERPRLEQRFEQATQAQEEAEAALQETRAALRRWLPSHGLPAHAEPDLALDIRNAAIEAGQIRDKREETRIQLLKRTRIVEDFHGELEDLRSELAEEVPGASLDAQVQHWADRLRREQREQERSVQLQREKRRLDTRIKELSRQQEETEKSRKELLTRGGTDSEETFLHLDRIRRNRAELIQEKLLHERSLQALYGPDNLQTARDILTAADPDQLKTEIEESESALAGAGEQLSGLDQAIGQLNIQIKTLSTDDALSTLKARRATLKTRLRESARTWLIYRSAGHLIAEARRRFEEERQPEVIQAASRFLKHFTEGRYTRVVAELEDTGRLAMLSRSGERVATDSLSRGTAEQLYLALRLGYIETTRSGAASLPVIMDDILVNFDPARRRAATKAIAAFATGTQVLYFTCHPDTAERLCSEAPDACLFDLQNGDIKPVTAVTGGAPASQN